MGKSDGVTLLLAGLIGAIVGGVLVWLLIRQLGKTSTTLTKTIKNYKHVEMWEDESGHLHAEVHREVKRVE